MARKTLWWPILSLALALAAASARADCPTRPNIILILSDDLGYADLPFFNRPVDWSYANRSTANEYRMMSPTRNRVDARLFSQVSGHVGDFGNPPFDVLVASPFPVFPVDGPTPEPTPFYRAPGGPCDTMIRPCNCSTTCSDAEKARDVVQGVGGLKWLADSGMTFTRFYAGSAVCVPTRAILMTGRHGERLNPLISGNEGSARIERASRTVERREVTIAEYLKQRCTGNPCYLPSCAPTGIAGAPGTPCYYTGIIGKWHFSADKPWDDGFDEAMIYDRATRGYFSGRPLECHGPACGTGIQTPRGKKTNCWDDTIPATDANGGAGCNFSVRAFADMARDFIDRAPRPFFLVLALTTVHDGHRAPPRTQKHYETSPSENPRGASYWALVEEMDAAVGRIRAKLVEETIENQTLVLFTSDQGPDGDPSRYGEPMLRGGKATVYDGGTRIPFIARACDAAGAPALVDRLASHVDLFRTIADAANFPLAASQPLGVVNPSIKGGPEGCVPGSANCDSHWVEGRSIYPLVQESSPPAERDFVYAMYREEITVTSRAGYFSGIAPSVGGVCSYYAEGTSPEGVTRIARGASCKTCSTSAGCANTPCRVLGMRCVPQNPTGACWTSTGPASGSCVRDNDASCASNAPYCIYANPEQYGRCITSNDCGGAACMPISVQCDDTRCDDAMWKLKTQQGQGPTGLSSNDELFDLASNPEEDARVFGDCNVSSGALVTIREHLRQKVVDGWDDCNAGTETGQCDP